MAGWLSALKRTRQYLDQALSRLFASQGRAGEPDLDQLEELLIRADVPPRLAGQLREEIWAARSSSDLPPARILARRLKECLAGSGPFAWRSPVKPLIVMVVGVNGSGKTTTCAKLASAARREGLNVVLAAADTFRAAGSDQLRWWGREVGCDVVGGAPGADAAAVAFDALDAALSRAADLLIIDTAGRMHTKTPLMQELKKVRNALSKRQPGAPQETWVVLDATAGHNAVVQTRVFHEAVPLTGAVVAKLDGSSKAGFLFSVGEELGVPVRFAGWGEGQDDLLPFKPEDFVNAMLGLEETPS